MHLFFPACRNNNVSGKWTHTIHSNLWILIGYRTHGNKTVLLRERKRHTARRVASTASAVLSPGAGVFPITGQEVPHPWLGVSPLGLGYPPRKGPGPSNWGTPLRRDLGPVTGVPPPRNGHGTSGSIMGWRWGTPLPKCGQTHTCENSNFPSYYLRGR